MNGMLAAVIAAFCLAGYLVLNKFAASDPTVGTFVVRTAGVVTACVVVLYSTTYGNVQITSSSFSGWQYVVLAGILIAIGDLCMFRAFSSGLPVSIAGPVISGGAVLLATLGGVLFLGESLSITKILGVATATIAVALLSV